MVHLSLILRTHRKSIGMVVCVCNPSVGEGETGGYLQLTSQPAYLLGELVPGQQETLSQN